MSVVTIARRSAGLNISAMRGRHKATCSGLLVVSCNLLVVVIDFYVHIDYTQ